MTDNAVSVLIIDDDLPTRRLLKRCLSVRKYRVIEAKAGDAGLDLLRSQKPDIVILELSLPDIDGTEAISLIREVSDAPIVVLSSRSDERTKVKALLSGADDYITKPFGTEELAARLQTALRHRFQEQGQRPIFSTGELMVDLVRRRVTVAGDEVRLSPTEFNLLRLLIAHPGYVLTHRHILREMRGREMRGDGGEDDLQYLRVYMSLLRRKLEPDPAQPRYILTEPRIGYRLLCDS